MLLGVMLSAAAEAQLQTSMSDRRISAVHVVGEVGATTAEEIGIVPGTRLRRRVLRRAVRRLLAAGRWADVQIDARPAPDQGVEVFVRLRPRMVLVRVDISGNQVLSDQTIRQALPVDEGSEVDRADLSSLSRAVTEAYAQAGYTSADVRLGLRSTDDPSRKVLQVAVREGPPLIVRAIAFEVGRADAAAPAPSASRRVLGAALDFSVGQVLHRRRLEQALVAAGRKLRERGYLEAALGEPDISVAEDGARLRIPARLGPRYRLRFRGLAPLDRQKLEGVFLFGETRLTRTSIDALRDRIVAVYQRHGFLHAAVRLDRHAGPRPNTAVMEIVAVPGPQVRVVGFGFPGSRHFSSDVLRRELTSVLEEDLPDTRLFSPVDSENADRLGLGGRTTPRIRRIPRPLEVDPTQVYFEPLYRDAMDHLQRLYQADGFLSARVGPARLEALPQGRAVVVVPIFEGPQTTLFAVHLRGNRRVGDRDLLEAGGWRRDEPFGYLRLEEAVERMTRLYRERGFLYARIEPQVRFSQNRQRAEVDLVVAERMAVRVGEIRIEGATRTQEGLIRAMLRVSPGDILRPSQLEASQAALMGLGAFTSVTVTPADPDVPEPRKPIVVRVHERTSQYFDLSAGISTGQGIRGAIEYGYRNIGGYGVSFVLRAQLGFQLLFQDDVLESNITSLSTGDRLERRVTATLALPHLPGLDRVRTTLDLVHLRDNERSFGLDKNGGVLSFLWTPLERLQLTVSGEFENNNVKLLGDALTLADLRETVPPRQQRLLRVPEGDSWVLSTRVRTAFDQRDSPFTPTEGWYTAATMEWAVTPLNGTPPSPDTAPFFSNFLKLGLTVNAYVPISGVVLAVQLRGGYIQHLERGSDTYPNRQYFLGGVDTLRGFFQDQVQPEDVANPPGGGAGLDPSVATLGGDLLMLGRAEVRIPLVSSLRAGVFLDVGNHWREPSNVVETFTLRPSLGLGLRFQTPVGPLAVDYGFNLDRREALREPVGAFHFSIGVF